MSRLEPTSVIKTDKVFCVVGLPFSTRKDADSHTRMKALESFLEEGYGLKVDKEVFPFETENSALGKNVSYRLMALANMPSDGVVQRLKRALNAVVYLYTDNYETTTVRNRRSRSTYYTGRE